MIWSTASAAVPERAGLVQRQPRQAQGPEVGYLVAQKGGFKELFACLQLLVVSSEEKRKKKIGMCKAKNLSVHSAVTSALEHFKLFILLLFSAFFQVRIQKCKQIFFSAADFNEGWPLLHVWKFLGWEESTVRSTVALEIKSKFPICFSWQRVLLTLSYRNAFASRDWAYKRGEREN